MSIPVAKPDTTVKPRPTSLRLNAAACALPSSLGCRVPTTAMQRVSLSSQDSAKIEKLNRVSSVAQFQRIVARMVNSYSEAFDAGFPKDLQDL